MASTSSRVFVTGGSGFVGTQVIGVLRRRGYLVHALVDRRELHKADDGVTAIRGSLFDTAAIDEGMRDCQAVIHLVGIIRERQSSGITFERIHYQGTRSVVDAAVRAGVRRYVHMSALGSRANAVSTYHRTKFMAEEYVRGSGLDWTIFRPSLIHGPGGEFMQMEARWAKGKAPPFLFMPYFGSGALGGGGAGKLQPVFVDEVARAFVDALENPKTIGEVYPLGGAEQVTWPELHRASAKAIVRRERWVRAVPVWYAKMLTHVVPPAMLPFNQDQVVMSQEGNTCDMAKFKDAFGWEPRGFGETLATYAVNL
jgi:NADH dehydrogenase